MSLLLAFALPVEGILGGVLLFGLLFAALLVAGFYFGVRVGRRVLPRPQKEILRALDELRHGRYELDLTVDDTELSGKVARAVMDLAHGLKERRRRFETRGARLGDALERAPGRALLLLDREFQITTAGDGLARMIGGLPSDFEAKPASSLFTPETWAELLPRLTDIEARKAGFAGHANLLRAAQRCLPVRVLVSGLARPEDGILVLLEQEERKDAGEEGPSVEEQLAHLRGVLDGLTDGIMVISRGRVADANPTLKSWLGDDLCGTDFKELLPAEDLLMALDRVARAELGETVEPFSCWMISSHTDLKPRHVDVFARQFVHEGAPATVLTVRDKGGDAGSRRRSRDIHARLRAVLENVADGFVFFSPPSSSEENWRVSLSNSRTDELLNLAQPVPLGATEEEFRDRIAHAFDDPAALGGFLDEVALSPGGEHLAAFDLAGSAQRSVEVVFRPVRGGGEGLLGRVLIIRDITRHRQVERRLSSDAADLDRARESLQRAYEEQAAVNRDLEQKTAELHRLNRELIEVDSARKGLLANVTHELQTPLVSIRGYTQMVLEGRLGKINDEQRHGLEVAVRGVDRMVALIGNILSLARSEGKTPVDLESVDPAPTLLEVFERHRKIAQDAQVTLEQVVEGDDLRISAERDAFEQVLDNLVSNGIKFNRPGGRVQVTLREGPPGFVSLEVVDTGIGIPRDEHDKVFERFYRGKGTNEVAGTGIGLATVRNLVERHRGRIEISSAPESGTTIRVLWPRASASTQASVTRNSEA